MYVLFSSEDPYVFEVDTCDLGIDADSVESACEQFCACLREQLNPETWEYNEFADCTTVNEKVELFRKWVTVIELIESKQYDLGVLHDVNDFTGYIVNLPLLKTLNAK